MKKPHVYTDLLTRAAMLMEKIGSAKWFFSHNRCLRYRVVQEGDLAMCGIGIGRQEGWEKGFP